MTPRSFAAIQGRAPIETVGGRGRGPVTQAPLHLVGVPRDDKACGFHSDVLEEQQAVPETFCAQACVGTFR